MSDIQAETPVGLALLIADHVYREAGSGKWIIAGVFSTVHTQQLPVKVARMEVFFQVTNISRPVDLKLRIEHAEDGEVLFEFGGPIKSKSPLEVIARKLEILNMPFRKEGKYWAQLTSGGDIVIQAPLYVNIMKKPPGGQQGAGENAPETPAE